MSGPIRPPEERGRRIFTPEAEALQLAQIFGTGAPAQGGGGPVSGPFAAPGEDPGILRNILRGSGQVLLSRIAGPELATSLIPSPGPSPGPAVQNIELPGGRILQVAEDGSSRMLDVPGQFALSPGETLLATDAQGRPTSEFRAETTKAQDALLGQRILDLTKPTDDPNRARIMATPEQAAVGRRLLNDAPDQYRLLPERNPSNLFRIVRKDDPERTVTQLFGDDPALDDYLASDDFEARKIEGGASTSVNVTANLMQPSTAGAVEKSLIGNVELINRLNSIEKSFFPEFFQWLPRLQNVATTVKSKAGVPLSPEDEQRLTRFATLGQNVDENAALFIKFITGAQMSEKEAQRLIPIQINRGDEPIAAWTKLTNKLGAGYTALARENILRQRGFTENYWEQMSLLETKQFIDRKMSESIATHQQSGMSDDEAYDAARGQMMELIGVDPQKILSVDSGAL